MAILKSSLEEPLLSREQCAVIRAIAHSTQLLEAEVLVSKQLEISDTGHPLIGQPLNAKISLMLNYLKAERERVLTHVKIPSLKVANQSIGNTLDPKCGS
jgi:hypothetical protein